MRHLLGLNRVELYTGLERELTYDQLEAYSSLIQRRLHYEPTAYITGHKEFFGLDFFVSPSVLIPRPETELLVERAIDFVKNTIGRSCLIADVGTGCGAIAIALAMHLPHVKIYATDISPAALEVAQYNCQRYGVRDRINFLHGDLLEPLPEPVHLILANLPYIRESELGSLSPEIAMFEPQLALNGGTDGLEQICKLISHAPDNLLPGSAILLEISPDQSQYVYALVEEHFPYNEVCMTHDLNGLDRVVSIMPGY